MCVPTVPSTVGVRLRLADHNLHTLHTLQVCLQAASLSLAKATERLPGDPDAWHHLALARAATQRPQAALDAAGSAWAAAQAASSSAGGDADAMRQAAAKLLPLAGKLLGTYVAQGGAPQQQAALLAAARLAAATAAHAGTPQQREQVEEQLLQAREAAEAAGLAATALELRSLSPTPPAGVSG